MDLTPVLVVGAGPVGMIAALELAQHGVRCIVAERGTSTSTHPKMDVVNTRSMELLDRIGLANPIRAAGVAPEHPSDVIWSTGLAGTPITTWHQPSVTESWRRIRDRNDGSQPAQPWQRLSQIVLEPLLRKRCSAHPLIDLRCGSAFESLTQNTNYVTSRLVHTATGAKRNVLSRYVIGCDGASSQVRQALGIQLKGFRVPELPAAYMIHLRSRDLTSLHRHGRFWHYFAFRYVILAQDEVDTWTVHVNAAAPNEFDPPPTDPAAFIREVLGIGLAIDQVEMTSRWRPSFMLAERYRCGRVLLAGDSAHQMFPTGGYGMNTGLADAVTAAWMIAALVRGVGDSALLDAYEVERRPVGLQNLHASHRHLTVHLAAGKMLHGGSALSELAAFLYDKRGENESAGIELGYRYANSPVVCLDGTPEPAWDPDRYTPTTWPGGRPPSLILCDGSSLFRRLGAGFTLVDFAGDGKADSLISAAAKRGFPLAHTVVHDDAARDLWARDLVIIRPDHHVAWRGNGPPPSPTGVIDQIRGAATTQGDSFDR